MVLTFFHPNFCAASDLSGLVTLNRCIPTFPARAFKMLVAFILTALFAATVHTHGVILNPPSRKLSPGMTKLCGQAAFDIARGDVTASLETVAPNITAGYEYIHTFNRDMRRLHRSLSLQAH